MENKKRIEELKKELELLEKEEAKQKAEELKKQKVKKLSKEEIKIAELEKQLAEARLKTGHEETAFETKSSDYMFKNKSVKSTENYLKIENLTKNYGSKPVLTGVNLEIKKGEKIAIIGSNGAGKSTLIEIIAGLKKQTTGTIEFGFQNNKLEKSMHLGMQFQETSYPSKVKVKDIIKLITSIQKVSITKEQLADMINLFNMSEIIDLKASTLSGGQKQRLNVFLSLIHKPQLLILDEIGAGLDARTWAFVKRYIMEYIKKYNVTAIAVSHNADEVMSFAERVVVIHAGKVFQDQKLETIISKHGTFNKYVEELFVKDLMDDQNSSFTKVMKELN